MTAPPGRCLDTSVAESLDAAEAALAGLEAALQPYLGLTLDAALKLGDGAADPAATALALAISVAALVRLIEASAGRAADACPALVRQLAAVDAAVKKKRRKRDEGEGGGGGASACVGAAPALRPPDKLHKKKKRGGKKR